MVCSNFRNLTIRDKLLDEKGMVDAFCEREILASPCDKLFSNKSHHNILFNEKIKCGEDKEFVVDCLGKSDSVLLTSIPGYFYYNNCDSIMHSHNCSSSELYYKQLSTLKIFEVLARKQYDQVLIDSFCNYFFETFREIKKIDKKTKRFLKNNADKLFKKYELNKRYKPKNKHYWILKFLYNYCTPLYYLI